MIACCVALVLLASCQSPTPAPQLRQPPTERYVKPTRPPASIEQRLKQMQEDVRAARDKNREVQREIEKDAR